MQSVVVIGGLVYSYYAVIQRITDLERRVGEANEQITELVSKHIVEEEKRFVQMEKELQWYQKELNLNPLSWKKKKK